jgi:cytochrome c-type biogenesis protein
LTAELPKFFLEGLASVVAPCVLPLLPTYLAAIAAVDAEHLGERRAATRVLRATVPFLIGLATVFVGLGLGVGALTSSGIADRPTIDQVAGIVLVVLGLTFMGLLPWPERVVGGGLLLRARDSGSRLLLGAAFAVCAAPCVGPLLAAALTDAARGQNVARAGVDLGVYSAGLGTAFLAAGFLFVPTMGALRFVRDHYRVLQAIGGLALVGFGLLLFFHRDWWLRAAFNDTLQALGLTD